MTSFLTGQSHSSLKASWLILVNFSIWRWNLKMTYLFFTVLSIIICNAKRHPLWVYSFACFISHRSGTLCQAANPVRRRLALAAKTCEIRFFKQDPTFILDLLLNSVFLDIYFLFVISLLINIFIVLFICQATFNSDYCLKRVNKDSVYVFIVFCRLFFQGSFEAQAWWRS